MKGLTVYRGALIAAFLLHLLLLTVQTGSRPTLVETPPARIAIRLRPAAAPVAPVTALSPLKQRPIVENDNQKQEKPRTAPQPAPAPAPLRPVEAPPAAASASLSPVGAPAVNTAEAALTAVPVSEAAATATTEPTVSQLAPYLAIVRTQIEQHKDYPAFARQLRQQGTVTVRLTIAPDGKLRSVEILSSSGHASLDKAALAAVRKAGRFAAPKNFALNDVTVDVPINYKLI